MAGLDADVIVVGAGTAGCVVAARLAEAGATVLVLEAGRQPATPAITDPARMHELWHSPVDWAYLTEPQADAYQRRLHLPRGRVVGGSHALNGMIWTRGNPADYRHWAYLGNTGWDWPQVLPFFERAEQRIGLLRDYEPDAVHKSFVAAATESGLPFNPDYNGAEQEGVSFLQFTIKDGRRWTTADAYLKQAMATTGRIRLITGVRVRGLRVTGARCTGVDWEQDGVLNRGRAGHQVVLCAGAIATPELLLRSGVGDAGQLTALGIPVTANLPGTGRNLQDHWLVPVIASTDLPAGLPKGLPTAQSHLFWRSEPGRAVPDIQPLHFGVPLYEPWMEGPSDGITIMVGLDRPASRGLLRLAAADGPLLIDPRVLSRQADVEALAAGVRLCREIIAMPSLSGEWGARELYPGSLASSADGLDAYIRETVVTYHHQCGTCKMGDDDEAVVDRELRVRGVCGLRVADASVMPAIPTGNTSAPVVMIAERAAELISSS